MDEYVLIHIACGNFFNIQNYILFYILYKIAIYNYMSYHYNRKEAMMAIFNMSKSYFDIEKTFLGPKLLVISNVFLCLSCGLFLIGLIFDISNGSIFAIALLNYELFFNFIHVFFVRFVK